MFQMRKLTNTADFKFLKYSSDIFIQILCSIAPSCVSSGPILLLGALDGSAKIATKFPQVDH